MSVLRFAEEFSRLVMNYMKDLHSIKDSTKTVIVPLSNEQIAFTVHHVLRALGVKDGETDNDDLMPNLVSKTEIHYSVDSFSKVDLDEREKENEYQDESQLESRPTVINGSSLSDTTLKVNGIKTENSLENGLQSEKKYISRSNPALCISVGRSDTFVCKEDHKTNANIEEDIFKTPLNENFLHSALEDIRKSVLGVTQKIDNLKKQTLSTKQSGQLFTSSFLNFDHTLIKKEPIKIHRSMTTFSGSSSVSSKLQVTGKTDTLADRRKSIGGSSCGIATPRKSRSPKLDNSKSLIDSISCSKLSPGLIPKLPKNPKYAHVKSTIPKPIPLMKKKAEAV